MEQTKKEFRTQKRKEFMKVKEALETLRIGSAYLPPSAYEQLKKANDYFNKALLDCRQWWKKY